MTAPAIRREWIPPGEWGNYVTLARMSELAHGAARHPLTIGTVRSILGSNGAPWDRWSRASLLRSWMQEHVRFREDPTGRGVFGAIEDLEMVIDPVQQLRNVQASYTTFGDCDDAATLGAALALPMGLTTRFRVVGFDPLGGFSHVWTDVLTEKGWLDLDVTRRSQVIPRIVRSDVFPV